MNLHLPASSNMNLHLPACDVLRRQTAEIIELEQYEDELRDRQLVVQQRFRDLANLANQGLEGGGGEKGSYRRPKYGATTTTDTTTAAAADSSSYVTAEERVPSPLLSTTASYTVSRLRGLGLGLGLGPIPELGNAGISKAELGNAGISKIARDMYVSPHLLSHPGLHQSSISNSTLDSLQSQQYTATIRSSGDPSKELSKEPSSYPFVPTHTMSSSLFSTLRASPRECSP